MCVANDHLQANGDFELFESKGKPAKRRWLRRLIAVLAVLVAVCCVAFALYVSDCYHADDEAFAAVEAGQAIATDVTTDEGADKQSQVPVVETSRCFAVGNQEANYGLVFYPGAKIEPTAYVPFARKLAERGVFCAVVKMPFNLASLDIIAASKVMSEYPQVDTWWIGGHSLGGAMAAQYAVEHANELEGIAFLAAYSAADLSGTELEACVVYGTNDGVLNFQKLEQCAANLPSNAVTLAIEGGNHAGFGCYGSQRSDGKASVSADEQQEQAAGFIVAAILG